MIVPEFPHENAFGQQLLSERTGSICDIVSSATKPSSLYLDGAVSADSSDANGLLWKSLCVTEPPKVLRATSFQSPHLNTEDLYVSLALWPATFGAASQFTSAPTLKEWLVSECNLEKKNVQ